MPPFLANVLLPFFVYWLILFVACYIVVEYGQTYLYDESPPGLGLRVALGSFLFAALLTWTRTSYETMFTHDLGWTVLQAIVWFIVFTLVFRFHPPHALAIGLACMVILSGAATLAISSMTGANVAGTPASRQPSKPLRRTLPAVPPLPKGESAAMSGEAAESKAAGAQP
jgi:hypothetical protein